MSFLFSVFLLCVYDLWGIFLFAIMKDDDHIFWFLFLIFNFYFILVLMVNEGKGRG